MVVHIYALLTVTLLTTPKRYTYQVLWGNFFILHYDLLSFIDSTDQYLSNNCSGFRVYKELLHMNLLCYNSKGWQFYYARTDDNFKIAIL